MVELHKKPNRNPHKPLCDLLLKGHLNDIPSEFYELEVLSDG